MIQRRKYRVFFEILTNTCFRFKRDLKDED